MSILSVNPVFRQITHVTEREKEKNHEYIQPEFSPPLNTAQDDRVRQIGIHQTSKSSFIQRNVIEFDHSTDTTEWIGKKTHLGSQEDVQQIPPIIDTAPLPVASPPRSVGETDKGKFSLLGIFGRFLLEPFRLVGCAFKMEGWDNDSCYRKE